MIRLLIVAFAVLPPTVLATDSKVVEPEASFTLADGWVNFHLERDGKPVKDARVTVLDGNQIWAQGDTGDSGKGTFPRPTGIHCQVVFDIGSGPSAPIPLTFLANHTVIPSRSIVRDGRTECCATQARHATDNQFPKDAATSTPTLRDRAMIGVTVLVVNAGCLGFVLWRTRRHNDFRFNPKRTKRERR